jgi:hypothetical protein
MTDLTRMLASLVGIAIGGGAGGALFYLVVSRYEKAVGMGDFIVVSLVVLIGGGVLGGGYLALWITTKLQKARKAKVRTRREQRKFATKKKGKK